ncbi:MAG: tRNA lysidine(34) synthetase TilS [Candidatus Kaelpia aquatica]|nr:tRNA lysidine(34) synthetase TilS [Candidatus Kaelpia aquatica]
MKLRDEIRGTIFEYSLIKKKESILLAVSGGPDSVAMTYILNELRSELGFNMALGYFHHGIRRESDREQEYVGSLASNFKIDFYTKKSDVPLISKKEKRSLEDIARRERYKFLVSTAKRKSFNKIAVAHNSDDQAETLLQRLIRGSGLKGFKGISFKMDMNGVEIVRPLLASSRKEIEKYLEKNKISPCIDKSNFDIKFNRNKVRHELIPYIEKEFNPNIKELLCKTASNMSQLHGFIEVEIEDAFKRCVKKESSYVKIKTDRLKRFHPYIMAELTRRAVEVVKGDLKRLEYSHWKEIESLIYERPDNSVVDLPGGIRVKKIKSWITVGR